MRELTQKTPKIQFHVFSLFPDFFSEPTQIGVYGAAIRSGAVKVNAVNPRAFTEDSHQTVDDRPFGGGDGMLMKVEPILKAVQALRKPKAPVVILSPAGRPLTTEMSLNWAENASDIVLVCGRYSGLDHRLIRLLGAEEVSVGDYVLSGGEPAALCLMDSVTRLIPGVLGHPDSSTEDSLFGDGLLEAPQFTRPREVAGLKVPEFYLQGNHAEIVKNQNRLSLLRTALQRPDLLSDENKESLQEACSWYQALAVEEQESFNLSLPELKKLL